MLDTKYREGTFLGNDSFLGKFSDAMEETLEIYATSCIVQKTFLVTSCSVSLSDHVTFAVAFTLVPSVGHLLSFLQVFLL